MIDKDDVFWAYKILLDREPESEAVINDKIKTLSSIPELRRCILNSDEYKQKSAFNSLQMTDGLSSDFKIDIDISESDKEALFSHIQNVWNHLGETEPHWSVLTSDRFKRENLNESENHFYDSGNADVGLLLRSLKRNGLDISKYKTCLEYGCGVGRITSWLANHFDEVHAFDISKTHLNIADDHLKKSGKANVDLNHIIKVGDLLSLPRVDVIYSLIVLQHNPPPLISMIIESFLRSLNQGGIAYFQVPTFRKGYRFSLKDYLNEDIHSLNMEMHILPQKYIYGLIYRGKAIALEVLEDALTGSPEGEISNTFLIQKL